MAVNDRRYGLSIIYCYRLQNNSSKNNNTLLSLLKENVTLCVIKGLLKQIVYINFLLWTNIFIKSSRRGAHWTPVQTAGLHINNPTVCVSRLRGCLASCLHQISVTNPWKSNTTKKPQRISLRFAMVDLHRLELWTVRLWAGCSNQLS